MYKIFRKFIGNNHNIYIIIAYILSIIFFVYLKLVKLTSKVEFIFPTNFYIKNTPPLIFCFWHGRLLSAIFARKIVHKATVLLSRGKDGDLVAVLMKLFKVNAIRGSTGRNNIDKGGATSFRQMFKLLKVYKEVIAIAPDGPIGPRMRVTPGVALLSLLTRVPIIPITMSSKRCIIFNSWDKFMLPLPFNKIIIKLGDPILPTEDNLAGIKLENYRKKIEDIMVNLTLEIDKILKRPLILPSKLDKTNKPLKRKYK